MPAKIQSPHISTSQQKKKKNRRGFASQIQPSQQVSSQSEEARKWLYERSESASFVIEKLGSFYFMKSQSDIKKDLATLRQSTSHMHDWTDNPELLYPPHFSKRMLCTSALFIFPTLLGFSLGLYDLAFGFLLVFFTSLNFWRRPTTGIRRNLDIICSVTTIWYHWYVAIVETPLPIKLYYTFVIIGGTSSYIQSGRYRAKGNLHLDSCFHCILHFFGIFGNSILYMFLIQWRSQPSWIFQAQ